MTCIRRLMNVRLAALRALVSLVAVIGILSAGLDHTFGAFAGGLPAAAATTEGTAAGKELLPSTDAVGEHVDCGCHSEAPAREEMTACAALRAAHAIVQMAAHGLRSLPPDRPPR
ncbi:MAG: hypothetical protein AB1490_16670 [Pseudomonadota bacterium]